jgi:sterol desaturase/sphingolipid hydroxylase (fatty acid hydroxylase superfamily)
MFCLSDLPAAFLSVWPHILAMDALRYLIPAGLAALLVFAWAPAWLRRRRLQARRPGAADFRREIGFSLLTVLIFSLTGFGIYVGMQAGLFEVYGDVGLHGWGWLAASIVLAVLAHDTYFYWAHRAMHHPWLYRRVHRLHHRSTTPTPWAAYAFHPAEALIEAGFLPLFLLAVPMHAGAVTAFLAVMILRNVAGHAGFELYPAGVACSRWLGGLATTTHHDMHHARPDGNYGLYFTWWDRLMGTEHPGYRARFDQATGRTPATALTDLVGRAH